MDINYIDLYRPISKLAVLLKMFERVVVRQLMAFLELDNLPPYRQSGFRPGHLTETAVLRVMSDILAAVDRGDFAAPVLLDLSGTFDTVNHGRLLERLWRSFGMIDSAHSCLSSYLTGRHQGVHLGGSIFQSTALECGVPQGSVPCPILYLLYTADLQAAVGQHELLPHFYANL